MYNYGMRNAAFILKRATV